MSRLESLWKLQDRKCAYCRCETHMPGTHGVPYGDTATIDHVIPRSKGGANSRDNIVMACQSCNQRKANSDPKGFWKPRITIEWPEIPKPRKRGTREEEAARQKERYKKKTGGWRENVTKRII